MSLTKRIECGKEVSTLASSCPSCGYPVGKATLECSDCGSAIPVGVEFCPKCHVIQIKSPAKVSPMAIKKKMLSRKSILVIILVIALFIGYSAMKDQEKSAQKEKGSTPDKIEIMGATQQLVEKSLKAPSTAKHPWGSDNYNIAKIGDRRYKVQSYVDSQNSYGAMLRTQYKAVIVRMNNTSWFLESIVTNP